jgi:hypothetical protein
MTTSAEEAATAILVSCKQTRFHIENPVYQEVTFDPNLLYEMLIIDQLNIEGLNITVTSGRGRSAEKPKGKARAEGLELLSNTTLRLKAGICYALIGRNGTGKSSEFNYSGRKAVPMASWLL